jgi:hypothetical protein
MTTALNKKSAQKQKSKSVTTASRKPLFRVLGHVSSYPPENASYTNKKQPAQTHYFLILLSFPLNLAGTKLITLYHKDKYRRNEILSGSKGKVLCSYLKVHRVHGNTPSMLDPCLHICYNEFI